MTNDRGQSQNPKSQIPNSKVHADSKLEHDDIGTEGSEETVETDGVESGGRGRLDARLKGVRRRKRAQRRTGCEVLAFKLRLVETESDGCEE
jgi:hypothetical protein